MRSLLLVSIFVISCSPDEPLEAIPNCGQDCAVDREGNLLLDGEARAATCNTGIVVCADTLETCEGFIPFSAEICDEFNVDEDCNGLANDIVYSPFDYRNTCELPGACASASMACDSTGNWFCRPASALYGEEVCDGVDNDCDGLMDAEDPDLPDGIFYYGGSEETLNVGECRAGITRCIEGEVKIFGQVLPRAEICGNDDDDDCDGLSDENSDPDQAVAILLVVDFSGSMLPYIEEVVDALCSLSANSVLSRSRFASQGIAVSSASEPFIETISEFGTAGETCTALQNYLAQNDLYGGFEYIADGIVAATTPGDLQIVWPESLRRQVIFFTDEPPDGYEVPYEEVFSQARDSCQENKFTVSGFIGQDHDNLWEPLTDNCSGWLENLTTDAEGMSETIQQRFIGQCTE